MRSIRFALVVAVIYGIIGAHGTVHASADMTALLDGYLKRWEQYGLSAAVLVARDEEIVLSSGYGLSNRETGAVISAETIFDIGSLSKQFTATAVLKLVEEGRLELHEPIQAVFPDIPKDKAAITAHHLLTHTSGVDDFGDTLTPLNRREFLQQWAAQPASSPPGEEYSYSNSGYTLLAGIVEEVSGEAFDQFVRRRLFEPAGLSATAFVWESEFPWSTTRVALGYGGFADSCGGEQPIVSIDSFLLRGSGGVLSSVAELYRWNRALDSGLVLKPELRALLFEPHTIAEADFLSYGYGWRMQQTPRATRLVWHTGLEGAFNSAYRRYEDEGLVVLFLSNQSIDGVPMRNLLLRPGREGMLGKLLFGGQVTIPPPVSPGNIPRDELVGEWRGPQGSLWRVALVDGALRLRAENQSSVDLLFTPDEAATEQNIIAGAQARELAEAIASGNESLLDKLNPTVDPLGYSGRGTEQIAYDWQQAARELGSFVSVQEVATSWTRSGAAHRTVTQLRIVFEHGALDEKFLVWSDDETYMIACRPDGFELALGAISNDSFVAFDAVSGRSWSVTLSSKPNRVLDILEVAPK